MSQSKSSLSRRAFLGRTAALAAVPYIVPGSVFGRNGAVPPSERIILGGIGLGGRGTGVMNWMLPEKDVQFVAICDPQRQRRQRIKEIVDARYGNKDCVMYHDIREFLATRTDIDALLIATGDRWHALASIYAMRAGKDVY
jgi:predicted dehydrogenase